MQQYQRETHLSQVSASKGGMAHTMVLADENWQMSSFDPCPTVSCLTVMPFVPEAGSYPLLECCCSSSGWEESIPCSSGHSNWLCRGQSPTRTDVITSDKGDAFPWKDPALLGLQHQALPRDSIYCSCEILESSGALSFKACDEIRSG